VHIERHDVRHSLWEETSRVPLIIRTPGGAEGQVTNTTASLLDLYPTLLDLADLPANPDNEGESLKPLLDGSNRTSDHVAITSYGFGNHAP